MIQGSPRRSPAAARRRAAALAMAAVGALLAPAPPAAAAGPCGDTVTVTSGDTLAGIARRCDSSVAALLQANPQITDPRRLQLGWALRLPGSDRPQAAGTAPAPAAATAEKRPAPAPSDIETVTGRPANRDGLTDDGYRPPRRTVQSMGIAPRSGTVGSTVTVTATGLPPGPAAIGVGLPGADMQQLATAAIGTAGSLEQAVAVPEWAGPGDDLVFTVKASDGPGLTSGRFLVTGTGGQAPVWQIAEGVLTVGGTLRQGSDCMLLETAGGHRYALVSDSWTFTPGARVMLTARPARWLPCSEGRGTIEVLALRGAAGDN